MEKEIKNFITDWNQNTKKLSSRNFMWGKSSLELLEYCLKIHQKVKIESLLIKLNNNYKELKNTISEISQLKHALEYTYHEQYYIINNERKFKYAGEKNGVYDIIVSRGLEYENNEIKIPIINQSIIDKLIIKEFKTDSYSQEHEYKFMLHQCKLYDYNLKRIKKWIDLIEKENTQNQKKDFLKLLPVFFEKIFNLESDFEKLEYWIEMYFLNTNLKYFEPFIQLDIKKKKNQLIDIFKSFHFKIIKKTYLSKLKKTINISEFIQKEIERNKFLLNKKPQSYSYRFSGEKPSYYDSYKELVNGNREYFESFIMTDRAGEVEATFDFIKYLENQIIKKKKKNIVTEYNKNELLPIEIFDNTRSYLEKNAIQVNICYKYKAYDACSILLRKITEILIIELYEKEDIENKILDDDGNPFMLKKLISSFQNEKKFKHLASRNVNEILPKIKRNGDLSAHNRKYNSRKLDIDKLSDDFRLLFEELINSIYH